MEEHELEQPQKDLEVEISDLDELDTEVHWSFPSFFLRKRPILSRQRKLFLILLNSLLILVIVLILGNIASVRNLVSTPFIRSTPAPLVSKGSPQSSTPTISPTLKVGAPGCHPASSLDESNIGIPEAQGTTPALGLWALFLYGTPTVKVENKIVWRISTRFQEPLQVVGLGPYSHRLLPLSLQRHLGSNWNRPGNEWGSVFTFPVAGCWDLHVTEGATGGDVWIMVS